MEIAWLEDFLALSSLKVFSHAADARNISQPAFTRRIQNLEYWVGTPLFDRSVHPVALTPAGEIFKATAQDVLKSLSIGRGEARGLAEKHGEIINIAALHTLAITFFPLWVSKMEPSLSALKARVSAENFSTCVEALSSGASDFMLCYHHAKVPTMIDDERYPSITLSKDRLIAVSAPTEDGKAKYSLEGGSIFPYLAFTEESLLGRITNFTLHEAGLENRTEFKYENSVSEALKSACVQGLGVTWLPYITVQSELRSGALIKISNAHQETPITVKLHRAIERSRSEIERIWALASSAKLG